MLMYWYYEFDKCNGLQNCDIMDIMEVYTTDVRKIYFTKQI